jgi:Zn-dependent M28 family amino/carboxypeptidase
MRLALFLALSVAALPAGAEKPAFDAQALAAAAQLREQAQQGSGAYALVESLTTEIGPRMPGSPADARAVAWAEAKFRALGFDRVWLQPVSFTAWQRHHERAEVMSPFPQQLTIAALGGSVGSNGPLQAEVVEFADLDALIAAPEGALRGKIAYINKRMTRTRDGSGYGPAVRARSAGASEAAKKGAVALVIRSIGTDRDRLPHTGDMRYAEGVNKIPAAALSNPDADLLSNMLRRGQPVQLRLDIDAGRGETYTSHNVIGEIRGRKQPEEVVVIGGHLDSWDLGTGAIDDAAGVAITMAAGALIGRLERAPRRTIRVIAFANEEQGLFGGRAYAESQKAGIARHQLGAESDFGAGRIYALRAGVSPQAWPAIEKIGEQLAPLGIVTEADKGGPGPDIGPLRDLRAPWAQLAQDGTDYFDWHHTANDTLDKVDAKALDQQAAAYAVLAYLAADANIDFGQSPDDGREE